MITWLRQHLAALRVALANLARQPLGTLLAILVIGSAFSLPASGYLLLENLARLARGLSESPAVTLFLQADASAVMVEDVRTRLQQHDGLQSVEYIDKARALEELSRDGLGDVIAGLERNPLPDAFVVTPRDQRPQTYEALRQTFAAWPGVAHVQLDTAWISRLHALLDFARNTVAAIGLLLGSTLIVVTFNTIRLQIQAHRHELEVSRLLGATRAYLRRPLVWTGALHGLLGGGVALAAVHLVVQLLGPSVAGLANSYGIAFTLAPPALRDTLLICGTATLLSLIGTLLAVHRHME